MRMVAIVNLSQLHQAFSFGFGFRRNAVIVAFSISFSFQKKISNENFKKIFIIFEFFWQKLSKTASKNKRVERNSVVD